MSLADERRADLEEAAEEEEENCGEEEDEPAIEEVQEEPQLEAGADSVKSIAKLWDSRAFAEIMQKIEEYISKQPKAAEVLGPVEAAPEYRVIVDANNLTVEIENELNIIHKFIRDKYSKRFPELESLVPNALDYIRTVKGFGMTPSTCPQPRVTPPLLPKFFMAPLLPLPLQDLRRKAARLVSAKCTLAARVDSFHESQDGKVGYDLKEEIERKFDKWQEPPPVKQVKPLPAPLDGQRKKRGGRRYRKMKERLGLTEIRKQANRMSFGEIEEDAYQEDLGFSLGHLGKSGSGRVRQTQVNEATKARISKTLQRTLQKQSMVYGGKSTIRDRS
ncbi:PRP31 protein, partial [Nycticryphes semicollaris]|nr:PRP31 protein [Nycticryphes semicollaris]